MTAPSATVAMFVHRRRCSLLKAAALSPDDLEARRVSVTDLATQMIAANESALAAGCSPPLTLDLSAMSAMGFYPGTDKATASNAFGHTIRYLYQICDRLFLDETPYATLHMHAADFGDHARLAFPDIDFGISLMSYTEVMMSPLDDLMFQCPLFALAIIPCVCNFVTYGKCSTWTSLSSNLANRGVVTPHHHAFTWAQQVSSYMNLMFISLTTPEANSARGQAALSAGIGPNMTYEELGAWMLAASQPRAVQPRGPASIIVDPSAPATSGFANDTQLPAAGVFTYLNITHYA